MRTPQLILGSASPRRRDLLRLLHIPYEVCVANVDEDQVNVADPVQNVLARAALKAEAVAKVVGGEKLILTADTTVALGEEMLNKPADSAEAVAMLQRLRGRQHQVYSAVMLHDLATGQMTQTVAAVSVWMRRYTDAEIDRYVATGDPLDKAGAYAIQHPIFQPVARLEGCYTAVVGLPLCHLIEALHRLGVHPPYTPAELTKAHERFACPLLAVLSN